MRKSASLRLSARWDCGNRTKGPDSMKIDVAAARKRLKSFDFATLFREDLGWDKYHIQVDVPMSGTVVSLAAVAQKRGFVAFVCYSIPDRATRLKIDHQI